VFRSQPRSDPLAAGHDADESQERAFLHVQESLWSSWIPQAGLASAGKSSSIQEQLVDVIVPLQHHAYAKQHGRPDTGVLRRNS
jgi:hypothetical protein